eukprot:CAMPEP_0202915598 /NCGR_PEP_ID=MMETSP1392-20130828/66108_1 /ASSEMBLY_ACC=CAM_ASM_000868 /TAXON_ID=225041 /ORGANISM="Chlamydomonas chlamydogama, Strain SAG 11-48b" /LENGTH=161 /DNA_ID=CAMNT_0049607697 /DNA_START=101 /DNA_END=583 /DNA_ORIENTATION=+
MFRLCFGCHAVATAPSPTLETVKVNTGNERSVEPGLTHIPAKAVGEGETLVQHVKIQAEPCGKENQLGLKKDKGASRVPKPAQSTGNPIGTQERSPQCIEICLLLLPQLAVKDPEFKRELEWLAGPTFPLIPWPTLMQYLQDHEISLTPPQLKLLGGLYGS